MSEMFEKQMEEVFARIESIFMPGALSQRRDEMIKLQESGDTKLFAGAVQWRIFLSDYDKALKGESEDLDKAFEDMSSTLSFLAEDHDEDTEVLCSIKLASDIDNKVDHD